MSDKDNIFKMPGRDRVRTRDVTDREAPMLLGQEDMVDAGDEDSVVVPFDEGTDHFESDARETSLGDLPSPSLGRTSHGREPLRSSDGSLIDLDAAAAAFEAFAANKPSGEAKPVEPAPEPTAEAYRPRENFLASDDFADDMADGEEEAETSFAAEAEETSDVSFEEEYEEQPEEADEQDTQLHDLAFDASEDPLPDMMLDDDDEGDFAELDAIFADSAEPDAQDEGGAELHAFDAFEDPAELDEDPAPEAMTEPEPEAEPQPDMMAEPEADHAEDDSDDERIGSVLDTLGRLSAEEPAPEPEDEPAVEMVEDEPEEDEPVEEEAAPVAAARPEPSAVDDRDFLASLTAQAEEEPEVATSSGIATTVAFDEDEFDEDWTDEEDFDDDEFADVESTVPEVALVPAAAAATNEAEVSDTTEVEPTVKPVPDNLPRIALMGEFSAGKSTLSNLLIGQAALPVNVTATQLPPVWISYGDEDPYRVDLEDNEETLSIDGLKAVSPKDTCYVRLFCESPFLRKCDIIDMPGISDPNMAAEVWQRVIHHADMVIWCSHATQAWRQSEAAVWSSMPRELYGKSILLLTRMDKILSERDQERVVRRVRKETEGLFRDVIPVSLIKALGEDEDSAAFHASGAGQLMDALDEMLTERPTTRKPSRPRSRVTKPVQDALSEEAPELTQAKPRRVVMPTRVRPRTMSAPPSRRSAEQSRPI